MIGKTEMVGKKTAPEKQTSPNTTHVWRPNTPPEYPRSSTVPSARCRRRSSCQNAEKFAQLELSHTQDRKFLYSGPFFERSESVLSSRRSAPGEPRECHRLASQAGRGR